MQKKQALVVEDDADVASGLQEALNVWGYEVDVTDNAAQALEVALSGRPDVIVMDGLALDIIGRVKAENPGVFVVVFSGWVHLGEKARAAGAQAFVLKPDFDGLLSAIASRAS
jgi:CheY-like chemotaxis protein